jgi:predicted MFS family arabinose efflux permease
MALALVMVRFADEWATFLPAGALEQTRSELGLSYREAGLILLALSAGGLLGNVFIVAADHVSRRWLAASGTLAYGGAMIGFGLAQSLPMLLAAAFVWGAASDALVHGCEVALVDLAGEALPAALARLNGWSAVGDLLGPPTLALAAVTGLGWRGALIGCGALMLGYATWLACLRLPGPHRDEGRPAPLAGVLTVLGDRRVLAAAALAGLFALLDEPLAGFLIAYLERAQGRSAAAANAVVMAWIAGELASLGLYSRLTAGRSGLTVMVWSASLLAMALAGTIFLPVLPLQVFAAAAFGAAGAIFYTTLQAWTLGLRPGQAGSVSAVVSLTGLLGMGFPVLAGQISDRFGLAAGLGLYAAVPIVLLIMLKAVKRCWPYGI